MHHKNSCGLLTFDFKRLALWAKARSDRRLMKDNGCLTEKNIMRGEELVRFRMMLWVKEVLGFRRTVTTPKKYCNNLASFDKSSSAQSLTLNIITNFKERQRFFSFGRCI